MKRGWFFSLLISLFAAGCGGGGGTPAVVGGTTPTTQHFSYGIVSADALGGATPRVVTNGSDAAVVTGVAGAAFTNVSVTPEASVGSTQIAFSRNGALYTMNSDGSNIQAVPGVGAIFLNFMYPSWSRDGRLVFCAATTPFQHIFMCNRDGSNLHRLFPSSGFWDYRPQWSPDNSRIVFTRVDASGHDQIYVSWSDGSGLKLLSDGQFSDDYPSWSLDSKTIYFSRNNGTNTNIYSVPSIGGTAVLVDNDQNGEVAPLVSPDGTRLVFGFTVSGTENGLGEFFFALPGFDTYLETANIQMQPLTFSPDGRHLLYLNTQSNVSSIVMSDPRFESPTTFLNYNDLALGDAGWEPFMGTVNMVSPTGTPTMGHTASGFLFGLLGKKVTSFATFTAKTPSTATLTADPISTFASNIIYHLGGDALTNISYMNGITTHLVSLLNSTNTAKGAVLAFDALDGTVASVLPYSKERPHGTALPDGSIKYSGEFLGAFENGKNLAPTGAKVVRLNAKTGKVLELR